VQIAASANENVPATHCSSCVAPEVATYEPGSAVVQGAFPDAEYEPGEQDVPTYVIVTDRVAVPLQLVGTADG
jgi:hypothetical protein